MVFKLKDKDSGIIEVDVRLLDSNTQINIEIGDDIVVIYEHGAVYVNGKEVGNWRKS